MFWGNDVALTGDQLKPLLRAKLREALGRRKDETAVDSWYEYCADQLGVSKNAFASWCYGREFMSAGGSAPSSLPSFENWAALRLMFPGIDEEVFGDITGESPPDSQAQAVIEAIEEVLADARKGIGGGLRAVPDGQT